MKVVVTGGTSFIGRELLSLLARDRTFQPVAVTRRRNAGLPAGIECLNAGDLAAPEAEEHLRMAFADAAAVVHLSALKGGRGEDEAETYRVNLKFTETVARAARDSGVQRLIFISSAHACGTVTKDRPLDESSPLEPSTAYAASKIACEDAVRRIATGTGLRWTIVRPPLVYGPGAKGTLTMLAKAVLHGLPLPLAFAGTNQRDLVGVANLALFIALCLTHEGAADEVFFVRDGSPLSTRALVETLAEAAGRPPRLFARSPELMGRIVSGIGAARIAERLVGSYEINDAKARRFLGWAAPFPVSYDMRRMIEALKAET